MIYFHQILKRPTHRTGKLSMALTRSIAVCVLFSWVSIWAVSNTRTLCPYLARGYDTHFGEVPLLMVYTG